MINRWFWFSVFSGIFVQTLHWSPARANTAPLTRDPAIEQSLFGAEFEDWARGFASSLDRVMPPL